MTNCLAQKQVPGRVTVSLLGERLAGGGSSLAVEGAISTYGSLHNIWDAAEGHREAYDPCVPSPGAYACSRITLEPVVLL